MNTQVLQPAQRANLLALPVELKCEILGQLAFDDLVNVTNACTTMHDAALSAPRLWQALPDVTVNQVGATLDEYIARAGPLGVDLCMYDIVPADDVASVASAVGRLLPCLRSLRLHFRDAMDSAEDQMPQAIWDALDSDSPLLERLAVDVDEDIAGLFCIPSNIFLGRPQQSLSDLQLTAVRLQDTVPAFANVRNVRAAVACVAPATRALNTKLHAHFPALDSLTLLAVRSVADESDERHSLSRLPFLDQALANLELRFELQRLDAEPEVAEWLGESLPHVHNATLIDDRCMATCDLVLTSLTGPEPLSIRVTPAVAGVRDVVVTNTAGRSRTVRFGGSVDQRHFASILALPGPVTALSLPGDVWSLLALLPFRNAAHLETLVLDVDGGFTMFPGLPALGSVRTLRFDAQHRVEIDGRVVLEFMANGTPAVQQVVISKFVRVRDVHALPVPYVLVD